MKSFRLIMLLLIAIISTSGIAQKGVTTFGLQYKPILPNRFIGYYEQNFNQDQFESSVKQKLGHSAGMLIRIGLSDRISLETGINFTQRNYGLNYTVPDSGYSAIDQVRVISYEIPLSALVYIRLGKQFFMNTSLGAAMALFPSDVQTTEPIGPNERFQQEGAYKSKLQGALIANLGFEYRTKSKGYWYIGSSYHLPFSNIMTFAMSYESEVESVLAIDNISGSYLTLDFRYFFHEPKREEKE